MTTVEVCALCDIADCHHIRARRATPPATQGYVDGLDLIHRLDAVVACQIGPSDEWAKATKDGYMQAATDCVFNVLRIQPAARPAPQPAADTPAPMYVGIDLAAKGGDETVVVIHNPTAAMLDAIRSADQPAVDTRVVPLSRLQAWLGMMAWTLRADGNEKAGIHANEIRAIIGTATPAPSDKIAEAALVLLGWWNTIDQDDPDMDVVLKIMGIMNSGDDDDRFDAALRALAGKGE